MFIGDIKMLKIIIGLVLVIWIASDALAAEENSEAIWLKYTAYIQGDGFNGKIELYKERETYSTPALILPGTITLNVYHAGSDKLLGTKEFVITSDYYERNLNCTDCNPFEFRIPRIPFSEFANNKLDPIIWHVEAIYEPDPDWSIFRVSCVETVMA